MSVVDELVKCGLCSSILKDPFVLDCNHIFCKSCLEANVSAGKLSCKVCSRVYSVKEGNVVKTFKQSGLIDFFMKYKTDNFTKIKADDVQEIDGICSECEPTAPKKENDSTETEQSTKKLSKCFHCSKVICLSCRNKHYEFCRKTTHKILSDLADGATSIRTTTGSKYFRKNYLFIISVI